MHLFAYGTLRFAEIWEMVVGKQFANEPATLAGFAIRRVVGDVFPVLIPADSSDEVVPGLVYRDIDETTLERLDAYESDIYVRVAVTARLADGAALCCQAYVVRSEAENAVSCERWDPDKFKNTGLAAYIDRFKSGC